MPPSRLRAPVPAAALALALAAAAGYLALSPGSAPPAPWGVSAPRRRKLRFDRDPKTVVRKAYTGSDAPPAMEEGYRLGGADLEQLKAKLSSMEDRLFFLDPSMEEGYRLGRAYAKRIADNQLTKGKAYPNAFQIPKSEWHVDVEAVDTALAQGGGCLVYSFGISRKGDGYTNYMADRGCEVHGFDPAALPRRSRGATNIHYHPWGIRNSAGEGRFSHEVYGSVTGELLTLPEIVERLGHDDYRTITALKFDCEGCEYGAFKDVVEFERRTGRRFNQILALNTEFHVSPTLGMADNEDVANIHYAELFLERQNCKVVHYHANKGYPADQFVNEKLLEAGLPDKNCCYEYGFSCRLATHRHDEE